MLNFVLQKLKVKNADTRLANISRRSLPHDGEQLIQLIQSFLPLLSAEGNRFSKKRCLVG